MKEPSEALTVQPINHQLDPPEDPPKDSKETTKPIKHQLDPSEDPPKDSKETTIPIPRAFLGRHFKEANDVELHITEESLRLSTAGAFDRASEDICEAFKWESITAISLEYSPMKQHRLLIEVQVTRQRESTGKVIKDPFLLLYFHSDHIHTIESLIKHQGLQSKVQPFPSLLTTQPFSYLYNPYLRLFSFYFNKLIGHVVLFCMFSSILKYFLHFFTVLCPLFEDLFNRIWAIHPALVPLFEDLFNRIWAIHPALVLLLVIPVAPTVLPFLLTAAVWGTVWLLADLVTHTPMVLIGFQNISMLIREFRSYTSDVSKVFQLVKMLWGEGKGYYERFVKYRPKKVKTA